MSLPFPDELAVQLAVNAVRAFGDDLTRAQARRLLSMWRYVGELTWQQRQAVLDAFPEVSR